MNESEHRSFVQECASGDVGGGVESYAGEVADWT